MWPFESAQFDLGRLVILVWVYLAVVDFVCSELVVLFYMPKLEENNESTV